MNSTEKDQNHYEPDNMADKDKINEPDSTVDKGDGRDPEKGQRPETAVKDNIVTWDGPDDMSNPKNWSVKRRWIATSLVSLITFMSPLVSSSIAPAETQIGDDLNVHSTFQLQLIFSIFVLAFVFGPFFIAPSSEIWGRVIVLQICNIWFLIWCLANAFAYNEGSMLAFRFLSGLGACAPQTVGGGVLSDLWTAEERGMAVAIYSVAPILGPALGPLIGAWIAEKSTWRWCFWSIVIFGTCVQILIYFTLGETYGPRILYWKAKRLRKETGNMDLKTEYELNDPSRLAHYKKAFVRPVILLTTQPIIVFVAIFQGFIFGIIYIMLSTFPTVWTDIYHETTGIGGLNYVSLLIGFWIGGQSSGWVLTKVYRHLSAKEPGGKGRPEFRIPLLFVGTVLISGGLFWFGWAAQARTFWLVPNFGAAFFAFGAMWVFTVCQAYLIDSYGLYSASAIGCSAVVRSLAGFGFPLFAPAMYKALGQGWGQSVLAFATLAIGLPGASVLWFYGKRLREASPYAANKH